MPSKKILELTFESDKPCVHCGYGSLRFIIYEENGESELVTNFTCLTYDEGQTMWRGDSLYDLLNILERGEVDDNLNEEQSAYLQFRITRLIKRGDNDDDEHN
jgi:hypothetical protein